MELEKMETVVQDFVLLNALPKKNLVQEEKMAMDVKCLKPVSLQEKVII